MQENPRSEPEVAEVSKNGLPFIRTVISKCHWGKKWGLMTEIGGGRNFENKIRGGRNFENNIPTFYGQDRWKTFVYEQKGLEIVKKRDFGVEHLFCEFFFYNFHKISIFDPLINFFYDFEPFCAYTNVFYRS